MNKTAANPKELATIKNYRIVLGDSRFRPLTEKEKGSLEKSTLDAFDILVWNKDAAEIDFPLAGVMAYFRQDIFDVYEKIQEGKKPVEELERLIFAGVLGAENIKDAVDDYFWNESDSRLSLSKTIQRLEQDIERAKKQFEKKYSFLLTKKQTKDNLIRYLAQERARELYEAEPEEDRDKKIKHLYELVIEGIRSIKDPDIFKKYAKITEAEENAFLWGRVLERASKETLQNFVKNRMTKGERYALDYFLAKRKYSGNGKYLESMAASLNDFANKGFGAECNYYIQHVVDSLEAIADKKQIVIDAQKKPSDKWLYAGIGAGAALALMLWIYSAVPGFIKGNPSARGQISLRSGTEIIEFYDHNKDNDLEIVDILTYDKDGALVKSKTLISPEFKEKHPIFAKLYANVMTPEQQKEYRKLYFDLMLQNRLN